VLHLVLTSSVIAYYDFGLPVPITVEPVLYFSIRAPGPPGLLPFRSPLRVAFFGLLEGTFYKLLITVKTMLYFAIRVEEKSVEKNQSLPQPALRRIFWPVGRDIL
jgi:hypothetical protein